MLSARIALLSKQVRGVLGDARGLHNFCSVYSTRLQCHGQIIWRRWQIGSGSNSYRFRRLARVGWAVFPKETAVQHPDQASRENYERKDQWKWFVDCECK